MRAFEKPNLRVGGVIPAQNFLFSEAFPSIVSFNFPFSHLFSRSAVSLVLKLSTYLSFWFSQKYLSSSSPLLKHFRRFAVIMQQSFDGEANVFSSSSEHGSKMASSLRPFD